MAALNALAKRDISVAFSRITNPDARVVRDTLELVLPELAQTYGSASATLAADWYDEVRRDQSIGGRFRAIAAKLPDKGRTAALAGWAVNPLFSSEPDRVATLSKLTGGFQKLVSDVNRDTITGSALADPDARGWQRVGAGGCEFCRMLIGRGAVYSEATADFASHDHCRCSAYPILGDMGTIDIMEPLPDPAEFAPDWSAVEADAFYRDYVMNQMHYTQQTAIEEYTVATYEPINRALRTGLKVADNENIALEYWELDFTGADLRERVDLMTKAIDGAPVTTKPFTVYRHTMEGEYTVGGVYTDPGFASTSLDVKFMEEYSGYDRAAYKELAQPPLSSKDLQGVQIEIEIPAGIKAVYLEPLTQAEGQYELLLQRGSRFQVVSKSKRYAPDGTALTFIKMRLLP